MLMITDNILLNTLLAMLTAVGVALITTPIVKAIAPHIGAVDIPKDNRRMHTKPMPLCGGIAIFLGFSVAMLLFSEMTAESWGIWLGCLAIVILGIVDDIFTLNAKLKFVLQFVAALIPVCFGLTMEHINVFGYNLHLGWFAYPLTLLWIVALTNAVNLIDGLDGLACSVTTVGSVALFAVGVIVSSPAIMITSASLFGACAGFLPYNFNPAKIFMGDTGAMFLGYTVAALSVYSFYQQPSDVSFMIPVLIFGFPIFDTAFAFARRIIVGRSPFSADRGHSHHRLIDRGFNQREAVAILDAVSALLGILAVFTALSSVTGRIVITCIATAAIIAVALFFKFRKKK